MRRVRVLFTGVLIFVSVRALAQNGTTSAPTTVPASINFIWNDVQRDFISLADAMPEDKWGFRPTQGAFSNVRTFAEQVKHVACANEAWAKQIIGEKPPERCDLGGPNPAKTKTELLVYLGDSFALVNRAIEGSSRENLLHPNPGPCWGPNRLSALVAEVWHVSDHYGQLVEYVRMNNIVPPASR